ncbi:MAG TPA: hypothetical protein VK932_00260 [Kofleriaceae bacterium]|nr:hypothetical protein [Kofleriaceae bacterium]
MKIALLPTGRTEWHGLPIALQRLFPAHEFYGLPEEGVFRSTGPFDGFTSSTLTERHEGEYLPERARDLVERAAQEALGDGSRREAADVVVVLDDLELANRHQPDRVLRVFRRAVERHLEDLQGARARTAQALRERVSFHLIVPMIEAWFFGDPQALRRAGVPDGVEPFLDNPDPENFLTTLDVRYVGATEAACPCWVARGKKKADCPKWLGRQRERHPKGYLQWLCHDGNAKNCTTYDESSGGAEALKGLEWGTLLDNPGLRYLGALLEYLAHALREQAPPMQSRGDPPPVTSLSGRPRNNVLRNL